MNCCIVVCLCCQLLVCKKDWMVSLFAFCGFIIVFNFYCCFLIPPKKHAKQTGHYKNEDAEKKKHNLFQLAQLCSQIVFLFSGVGLKNCWKQNKIMVSTCFGRWPKNQISGAKAWSKVESKIVPSMLHNILGPIFESRKWSFLMFCWALVFEKMELALLKEEY